MPLGLGQGNGLPHCFRTWPIQVVANPPRPGESWGNAEMVVVVVALPFREVGEVRARNGKICTGKHLPIFRPNTVNSNDRVKDIVQLSTLSPSLSLELHISIFFVT
jgi:hypothetical protein